MYCVNNGDRYFHLNNRFPIILFVVVLATAGYLFVNFFERYEEVEDLGWTKAALRNPLLAAELFLRQSAIEGPRDVQSLSNLDALTDLNSINTIFISNSSQVLSEKRLKTLLDWLENGGHLIVAAQSPLNSEDDRLLGHFSIHTRKTDFVPKHNESILFQDSSAESPPSTDLNNNNNSTLETDRGSDENYPAETISDKDKEDRKEKQTKKLSQAMRDYNQRVRDGETENVELIFDKPKTPEVVLTTLTFENSNAKANIAFDPARALEHPYFSYEDDTPFEGWQPFYWDGG